MLEAVLRQDQESDCLSGEVPILFKLDGLVLPVVIKRRSPDLVRCLVFGAAKTEIGSKTQVEIARILEDVDKLLGIELRSSAF